MKRGWFLLSVLLLPFLPLLSQPLAVVPRAGEGRSPRSSEAALWVNPVFVQPSVFFSERELKLRWRRAWWRAEKEPVQPVNWSSLSPSENSSGFVPDNSDSLSRLPFLLPRLQSLPPRLPASLLDGIFPRPPRKRSSQESNLLRR